MHSHPALILSVSAFVLGASPAAEATVQVALEPVKASFGRGDEVLLRLSFTNTSGTAQQVLRWRTAQDGVEAPLFEVRRDGQPVRYLGRRIKRGTPTPADYLRLEPGASLVQTVELSALYEMQVTGAYTVRYHSPAPLSAPGGVQAVAGELASSPVHIWVEGRLARGSRPGALAAPQEPAGLSFSKCSNAQQEQLGVAFEAGRAMAADSQAYLAGAGYGERYATWFGAQDGQRGARVKANFTKIREAFDTKPVKVDCGCDEPYFAYVYPAQPYTIYVCKAFWTAAPTGTDSRGGTLVHEMSHFDVVAATDDHVYGQSGAMELAKSAPERAVNNADSHEYFGENSPPLQ